jgi:hypothetical protein
MPSTSDVHEQKAGYRSPPRTSAESNGYSAMKSTDDALTVSLAGREGLNPLEQGGDLLRHAPCLGQPIRHLRGVKAELVSLITGAALSPTPSLIHPIRSDWGLALQCKATPGGTRPIRTQGTGCMGFAGGARQRTTLSPAKPATHRLPQSMIGAHSSPSPIACRGTQCVADPGQGHWAHGGVRQGALLPFACDAMDARSAA